MNDLKPCPFCGGKAELYESEAYNLKTETKGKAIEAWNRRVKDE